MLKHATYGAGSTVNMLFSSSRNEYFVKGEHRFSWTHYSIDPQVDMYSIVIHGTCTYPSLDGVIVEAPYKIWTTAETKFECEIVLPGGQTKKEKGDDINFIRKYLDMGPQRVTLIRGRRNKHDSGFGILHVRVIGE